MCNTLVYYTHVCHSHSSNFEVFTWVQGPKPQIHWSEGMSSVLVWDEHAELVSYVGMLTRMDLLPSIPFDAGETSDSLGPSLSGAEKLPQSVRMVEQTPTKRSGRDATRLA